MVQGDNKFKMLINISAPCDDTWINITLLRRRSSLNKKNKPHRHADTMYLGLCMYIPADKGKSFS